MAEPDVKRELDGLQRMLKLNVDTLLSMNGEAQAMEAQFDGADGEAASSADFLDELEDLSLEELATAESQIEGLQELDFDMQRLMIQKQEQELQHEARKQEQELRFREQEFQSEAKKQEQEFRVREQEFHVKEQEFQFEVKKQIFLHERRDKQLDFMQDGHELYMMQ